MTPCVPTRQLGFALIALLGALVGVGCSSTYTVDVTNSTRSTLEARLEIESLGSGQAVLTKAVLGPGEYRTLGPVKAPITDRVRLTVTRASGSGGFAERVRLEAGKTFAEIGADEYGGSSLGISIRRDP
ncbi:MAG: hypothetical protein KDA31_13785 [Phycisphaerales bacterium]|nr:hypothetical protein [Phycisphaerales bacterium]MCB9837659.1 hypothetical protein [Phycisphaera sp.]